MFYTVYKITNTINNKIYIGVHQTNNLDDNYMGSGESIKHAIKKYGIENFHREYIHIFDNKEEMFDMESIIVNEEFVKSNGTYNLKEGGFGGFDHINDGSKEHIERCRDGGKLGAKIGNQRIKELRNMTEYDKKYRERVVKHLPNGRTAPHTEETKQKMSESHTGTKNSQYGTSWYILETAKDVSSRKKFKRGEQPDGFITSTEWRENNKRKYGTRGTKWFNDGSNNFLKKDGEDITGLIRGRLVPRVNHRYV